MEKYRDSVFPVPPYRPVANLPNDYDADGSVLKGMAASIDQVVQGMPCAKRQPAHASIGKMSQRLFRGSDSTPTCSLLQLLSTLLAPALAQCPQFWHHCYGADRNGGAVAAACAAAQQVLQQLSCVPLDIAAAGQLCDQIFKRQGQVASSLSVRAFMERQHQVRGRGCLMPECRRCLMSRLEGRSWSHAVMERCKANSPLHSVLHPGSILKLHALRTHCCRRMLPSLRRRAPCLPPRLCLRMTRTCWPCSPR